MISELLEDWPGRVVLGVIALCAIALAVAIPMAIRSGNDWNRWCESQGGHVQEHSETTTVIGFNGKPGVGVTTTHYCLTDDGRILGIR